MDRNDIKLLDCTLRDGGYINGWKWGKNTAKDIIHNLTKARIDIVEVGFLRDIDCYNPDISVGSRIEELNELLPFDRTGTSYSAMAMCSNYSSSKLSPYNGSGIEIIRTTMHDYDVKEGLDFAGEIKKKGYKVSINPINIMGYKDEQIMWIIEKVNEVHPWQFSIVDTFGSMKRRDLDRIVSIVDQNLEQNIRLAIHLHENMSLSFCLAQIFLDKDLKRPITIDGSLLGMGRNPGNLPLEIIADYCNEYCGKNYELDYLLDAIYEHIEPLKGKTEWGYSVEYFLSGKYNLHRNYAEHFLKKGDLSSKDVNHILARIDDSRKTKFDAAYADEVYRDYKNNRIDDSKTIEYLKGEVSRRKVLILAPGHSLKKHQDEVEEYLAENDPIVISVNFLPDVFPVDFAFFSNPRRLEQYSGQHHRTQIITTSNILHADNELRLNYNDPNRGEGTEENGFILLLNLLQKLNVQEVAAAGADGYTDEENYCDDRLHSLRKHSHSFNQMVARHIKGMNCAVTFITPSLYDLEFEK